MRINIGTVGWTIPSAAAPAFPADGTSLERYAARFNSVEINSSFHRPHRVTTWERWRDSVPDEFRFAVKLPKTITHQAKLIDCGAALGEFLSQAYGLGDKLGVLLVQLPPKLEFDSSAALAFFADFAARTADWTGAAIACEPRNSSWFTPAADAVLEQLKVARVAADPALSPDASAPGGWPGLAYWRLHGSPVMYRSSYADRIADYARAIAAASAPNRWCMFDNTASSAATGDALALAEQARTAAR